MQLGDEINGTKGTKWLQNNDTNIEQKSTACQNWQTGVDDDA